ncbi:serine/threonine-protein kinase [Actinocatenispora sera]|uniref:serine/threonine-protein kinase n=1 Tax=Actinocatenispora sera TaxID=390989 RepID=UPI00340D9FFE
MTGPMAGPIAGRYRLEEQVGLGGMGLVWRATDLELRRTVAVKRSQETGPRAGRALRREARTAAVLQHPHVVTLYDVVTDGEQRWLVMEYVPWRSLAQLLAESGPIGPARAAALGVQLAEALDALHAKGIVHADVKPGNVLVGPQDAVKLIDFGLSRPVPSVPGPRRPPGSAGPVPAGPRTGPSAAGAPAGDGDGTAGQRDGVAGRPERAGIGGPTWSTTGAGTVGGTPAFQAPEVAAGGPATTAADLFSLGATLYAAVEGHSPYGPVSHPAALHRRALAGALLPAPHAGTLAPALTALLSTDPAARPEAATTRQLLTATAGPRPRRLGRTAAAVAVAALTAAFAVAVGGDAVRPAPRPSLGDPATADPCALLDPSGLRRYGDVDLQTAYGNFNRCDVIVDREHGADLDVQVEFDVGTVPGPRATVAGLPVHREKQDDGACAREIPVPGGYRVWVVAVLDGDGSAELCPVADTATTAAATVLRRGTVPRRHPFPAGSLGRVDGCALLRGVPGVATPIERGFAGWDCAADGAEHTSLRWRFDRNEPLTSEDGRPVRLAGRSAFVTADGDGDGTCLVQVVQRRYDDPANGPTEELLYLVVQGDGAGARRCPLAERLAGAAARRLPPR